MKIDLIHITLFFLVLAVVIGVGISVYSSVYYEYLNCSAENLTQCTMNITAVLSTL